MLSALLCRHNGHDGVSNHQPHDCLLNRPRRRRSKKTWKLRVTGLCAGKSPGLVNSPQKGPVTRKMFPFDDVIMGKMSAILLRPRCVRISIIQSYFTSTKETASKLFKPMLTYYQLALSKEKIRWNLDQNKKFIWKYCQPIRPVKMNSHAHEHSNNSDIIIIMECVLTSWSRWAITCYTERLVATHWYFLHPTFQFVDAFPFWRC